MDGVQIISAYLHNRNNCQTATVYQYNMGMVLKIIGPTLPTAYEVDFANSVTGQSITQIGGVNGVTIPDQFFVPGSMIHAWVVLTGADYVVTRYHIMIPISPRAVRTNEEPTPSQQSALDEAIAALNTAVDEAEAARDAIEDMGVSASTLAAGSPATVTKSVDPETGAVSLAFGIPEGPEGSAGADGKDGKDGEPGRDGTDGQDGTDGKSAYVWIRYAAAEPTQDSDMKITPDAWMGIYSGDSAIAPTAYTAYTWYNIKGQPGPVSDVKVNGTSVLNAQGIANVPVATVENPGVVCHDSSLGIGLTNTTKKLYINKAGDTYIKPGTDQYRVIVPYNQHFAAFYGLAKAAGDTTQSQSSNAIGQYTESAKSAISTMLNGPVSVSGSTPAITALPGIQYVCGEVSTLDITLPASGCVDVVFESGSTPTVLTITPPSGITVKWANGFDPTALEANCTYEINIKDGLGVAGSWT